QAMLGNPEAAATILRAELERDPDCFECHYFLALSLLNTGDQAGAHAHLERAVALRPDDFLVRYNLGGLLVSLSRFAEALPHLRKARELDRELFAEGWSGDEQFAAARSRPEFGELS